MVLSGTTEDVMGKTSATDTSQTETCGGAGGADVVYGSPSKGLPINARSPPFSPGCT